MHFTSLLLSTLSFSTLSSFVLAIPLAPNPNSNSAASPRDFHPNLNAHLDSRHVIDPSRKRFMRRKAGKRGTTCAAASAGSAGSASSGSGGGINPAYSYNATSPTVAASAAASASASASGDAGQLLAGSAGKSSGGSGGSGSGSGNKHHHTTASTGTANEASPTSSAETSQSSSASGSSGGSGGSSGGNALDSSGIATFFTQNGNPGACGNYNSDSTFLIALATSQYNNGANCGKTVKITAANGVSQTAIVADECPPCEAGHIDMSTGLWNSFGYGVDAGIFDVTWECEGCTW